MVNKVPNKSQLAEILERSGVDVGELEDKRKAREARRLCGRRSRYKLALPVERRRVRVGDGAGSDPRTVQLRSSILRSDE